MVELGPKREWTAGHHGRIVLLKQDKYITEVQTLVKFVDSCITAVPTTNCWDASCRDNSTI